MNYFDDNCVTIIISLIIIRWILLYFDRSSESLKMLIGSPEKFLKLLSRNKYGEGRMVLIKLLKTTIHKF